MHGTLYVFFDKIFKNPCHTFNDENDFKAYNDLHNLRAQYAGYF